MIIGIDLGTTNSLVSIWQDGQPVLIPNALGDVLTPSVVGFSDDDAVLVGQAAKDRLITHPQLTAAAFKRFMGSDKQLSLGRRNLRAEELSALVLRSLKADAEAYLGHEVTEAVITVPAYFNDVQRKATKAAGELAGLQVDRLVNEPTAAALAYGLQEADDESQFLVFDLGGGTFDISILELFSGVMEVHACAGDNVLGGEDFVDVMVYTFINKHDLKDLDAQQRAKIRHAAEAAKRELSKSATVTMSVTLAETHQWEITSEAFETLCEPLLKRLRQPIETSLRDANIRAAELDAVVLVGGSTHMPLIQKMASRLFGHLPLRTISPDTVVAMGAAVQAGLVARDASLNEVVMTDVCPFTLGTETTRQFSETEFEAGHYLPIIERNTVIPASRMNTVCPLQDNQEYVDVRVFQGEAPFVKDNILLGNLQIAMPPKTSSEEGAVDIRFSYDMNGLLEVEATIQKTGEVHQLVIQQNPGLLSDVEIATRLESLQQLKVHPRDDLENAAIIARAERLYAQLLGEGRQNISTAISQFRLILEAQNPTDIRRARSDFSKFLDKFENDLWE